jgi:hypothetical protein
MTIFGRAAVGTGGTPSIREEYAPLAYYSGRLLNAYHAPNGRLIQSGIYDRWVRYILCHSTVIMAATPTTTKQVRAKERGTEPKFSQKIAIKIAKTPRETRPISLGFIYGYLLPHAIYPPLTCLFSFCDEFMNL